MAPEIGTGLDDTFKYRGCEISVRVRPLLSGRFRAEHIVVPISEEAHEATGNVPRLVSAREFVSEGPDPAGSALSRTIVAAKAFVDLLYDTRRYEPSRKGDQGDR